VKTLCTIIYAKTNNCFILLAITCLLGAGRAAERPARRDARLEEELRGLWATTHAEDAGEPGVDPRLAEEFERRYGAWLKFLDDPGTRFSSGARQIGNPYFDAIVAMGPKAVPMLLRRLQAATEFEEKARAWRRGHPPGEPIPRTAGDAVAPEWLILAISRVTRVSRSVAARPALEPGAWEAQATAYVAWFNNLEENTRTEFEKRAPAWRGLSEGAKPVLWTETTFYWPQMGELPTRREFTEAGRAYRALLDLGIPALPLIVERLRMGETCFVPIFEELTKSRVFVHGPSAAVTSSNCIEWWERNKNDWTIPKYNP